MADLAVDQDPDKLLVEVYLVDSTQAVQATDFHMENKKNVNHFAKFYYFLYGCIFLKNNVLNFKYTAGCNASLINFYSEIT
jgi:hypothetical protein